MLKHFVIVQTQCLTIDKIIQYCIEETKLRKKFQNLSVQYMYIIIL